MQQITRFLRIPQTIQWPTFGVLCPVPRFYVSPLLAWRIAVFVDRVSISCRGGKGGDGCVAFRREKYIPKGGPSGGDGGNGGSVILRANNQMGSLGNLTMKRLWTATDGKHGQGARCSGLQGEDTLIEVPVGTIVRDAKRGNILKDLAEEGMTVVIAAGGKGGRGNQHFATAHNHVPRYAEPGEEGEEREVSLELKLIADVGIIGKPNAGKSTLLSVVSRATPEIASYPFTTKFPNLGLVQVGMDHQFVLADIPGLIEGAHAGVGLGHEFLRHVERTRLLVHLVEPAPMDQTNPIENYHQIREELKLYSEELAARPEIICVSKSELPEANDIAEELRQSTGKEVFLFSSATKDNLRPLVEKISEKLKAMKEAELYPQG